MNDISNMTVDEMIASMTPMEKDTLYFALLGVEEGGGLGNDTPLLKQLFEKVK